MSLPPPSRRTRLRSLLVDLEPVKRDRDFRMLWLGQLVSGVGRQVTYVALPGAPHYLEGHRPEAFGHVVPWLQARFP